MHPPYCALRRKCWMSRSACFTRTKSSQLGRISGSLRLPCLFCIVCVCVCVCVWRYTLQLLYLCTNDVDLKSTLILTHTHTHNVQNRQGNRKLPEIRPNWELLVCMKQALRDIQRSNSAVPLPQPATATFDNQDLQYAGVNALTNTQIQSLQQGAADPSK